MGMSITLDRNAEILFSGKVQIKVEPPALVGPTVVLTASYEGIKSVYSGAQKIMYTLPSDKQVGLQISYVDKNGNPATVDGEVEWESSDVNIVSLDTLDTPEGAAGAVTIKAGKVGNAQVTAKADADLGEGTRELVTMLDVTVVAGEAVAGTITPIGEPMPQSKSAARK